MTSFSVIIMVHKYTGDRSMWRSLRDERGSLYVEAIVAIAIIAVAIMPILAGYVATGRSQEAAGERQVALNLARARLEQLQASARGAWATEVVSRPAQPEPAPYNRYTISQTVALRAGLPDLKDVTVTVTWTDRFGSATSVTLSTSLARRPW